ncbi:MAG: SMP-30/gluconolactonase/LRE family protein [Thermoleophilia bacterium]
MLLWQVAYGDYYEGASPAVAADGTIYVGHAASGPDETAVLQAISQDGAPLWEFHTNGDESPPDATIAPDGTIYVGSWVGTLEDGRLYALAPDGTLRWELEVGDLTYAPALAPDGTVYVCDSEGRLFAIDAGGSVLWECDTGGVLNLSPLAIGFDGTVYLGASVEVGANHRGMVFAVSSDGVVRWRYDPLDSVDYPQTMNQSPAIAPDGTIYIMGAHPSGFLTPDAGTLYAIDPDGNELWRYRFRGLVQSGPSVSADGTVYFSCAAVVYAVNPDGTERWRLATSHEVDSKPAIDAQGTLYFISHDGLMVVDPDGSMEYHVSGPGAVSASPAIGANAVYVAGNTGVAAFGEGR